MKNKAARLNYQDIKIGEVYKFTRQITRQDMYDFAKLSGNFNSLHFDKIDKNYGKKTSMVIL